jgi:hypothetical protein
MSTRKSWTINDRTTEFNTEFELTEADSAWYIARGFG